MTIDGAKGVAVNVKTKTVYIVSSHEVTMDGAVEALKKYPKYQITEFRPVPPSEVPPLDEHT